MNAKLKCPSCGVELENVSSHAGKTQWLWSLVPLLIVFYILWQPGAAAYTEELQLQDTRQTVSGDTLSVLGAIKNSGWRLWERVFIEAEFFAKDGTFLGDRGERVDGSIRKRSTERFSVEIRDIPPEFRPGEGRIELKISDASNPQF